MTIFTRQNCGSGASAGTNGHIQHLREHASSKLGPTQVALCCAAAAAAAAASNTFVGHAIHQKRYSFVTAAKVVLVLLISLQLQGLSQRQCAAPIGVACSMHGVDLSELDCHYCTDDSTRRVPTTTECMFNDAYIVVAV
eukprot:18211-Heterococcus_DN1.PRE.2